MPARTTYVYCVVEADTFNCKVGIADDPYHRLRTLQTGNPRRLTLHAVLKGTSRTEAMIHAVFAKQRLVGEWFSDPDGWVRGWFDRNGGSLDFDQMRHEPFAFVGSKRASKTMVIH